MPLAFPSQSRPLRIAVLADSPLAQIKTGRAGRDVGQSTWLSQIASEFAKRHEFEFYWVSFDPSLRGPQREVLDGITFLAHPGIRWQFDDWGALIPSRLLLNRMLRSIRPDVIHAWGSERTYASVLKRGGTPSIFSVQGLLKRCAEVGGLPRHRYWEVAMRREQRFVNAASIVTAESRWAISLLEHCYAPQETRQVEYGVHPSFYSVPWQPKPDEPSFVFVGSLTELKGVPGLIEAVRRCRTRNWRLYLVGDGRLANWVTEQKLERVECLGMVGWDQLQTRLSKAWALVHPTKADSSPNAVKEARVIGLPVITTADGGQAGYVHDRENGIIVPTSDPSALSSAIDELAGNFDMVKKMGRTHHERDRDYFRPEKTASAFCDLYLELARRRAG